ncbi:hypothetical protein [Rhodococcus sp. X156]|uniref:hypothetical protein n=1 Tax=Rhodococcus sp. X156 TaxID=2499145 RepID=UPI001F4937D6|nr:hypothetical protein [Rhodococcus sp. X156]
MKLRNLPTRLATGGFILHSGLEKWNLPPEGAAGYHGMAVGAFPFLGKVEAPTFVRALACAEVAVGGLLLAPFVPAAVAGAALTGFSAGLVTMYLRTPALRQEDSIWPSQDGIAVAKDVWMLGIGLGLLLDAAPGTHHGHAHAHRALAAHPHEHHGSCHRPHPGLAHAR